MNRHDIRIALGYHKRTRSYRQGPLADGKRRRCGEAWRVTKTWCSSPPTSARRNRQALSTHADGINMRVGLILAGHASTWPSEVNARRTHPVLLARADRIPPSQRRNCGTSTGGSGFATAPPAGRLVDVGGWHLHLNCAGEVRTSRPTVILEAGAGDFSVDWSLVQPGVARVARVCSYDRAGGAGRAVACRQAGHRQAQRSSHSAR